MSLESIDFEARLLELAHAQAATKAAEARLAEVVATTVDPLRNAVALAQNEEARLERALREDALAYVQETGNLDLHPSLTFRRTTKLAYDREAALAYVTLRGLDGYYEAITRLDVREFEKAARNGAFPDFDVELVNAPTVAISKLGHLLIEADIDARNQDGEA